MKKYEQFSQLKIINDLPIIIRIDGRSFSKYTKQLKLKKPFDIRLRDIFIEVSKDLANEFNTKYVYTFSDEINILLEEIPFNGRVEKIDSVICSYITASFMKHLFLNNDKFDVDVTKLKPVSFDSRIIITAHHQQDYFKWRQDEAWRNCLNSYAQATLNKNHSNEETAKILYKLNKSEIHELLFEHDINIAHVPTWQKRGVAIYKIEQEIEGYNPKLNKKTISTRNKIYVDTEVTLIK
ncbi:tRNA(His) guanylyltransferase Thg1 family protein [Methanosphaera sp.]